MVLQRELAQLWKGGIGLIPAPGCWLGFYAWERGVCLKGPFKASGILMFFSLLLGSAFLSEEDS